MSESKNKKNITVRHLCGYRFLGSNDKGDSIIMDADNPKTSLAPMELLLSALGGCTAYDVISIMKKKRKPLTDYRIEIEGERADTYPKKYTKIKLIHYGKGENITQKAFYSAVKLSHEKYCSISANLNAEIEYEAIIENE